MLVLAMLACSTPPVPDTPRRPRGLHPIPIEQLKTELTGQRSRPRVYNFWATWCRPCLAEMPGLRAFGAAHPEVDLVFVNLDLPRLHETKVRKTIGRMQLEAFEHLALDDEDPAGAIHVVGDWPDSVPVTMLVSPTGERVKQFNVSVPASTLERALEKL